MVELDDRLLLWRRPQNTTPRGVPACSSFEDIGVGTSDGLHGGDSAATYKRRRLIITVECITHFKRSDSRAMTSPWKAIKCLVVS
jgi:hypothetical protein